MFGAFGFFLLSMAIGYGNNLLYIFVFLLISIALTGARLTNKNVQNFLVNSLSINSVFAKEKNNLDVQVQNLSSKEPLWQIEIGVDQKERSQIEYVMIDHVMKGPALQSTKVIWRPLTRGLQKIPRLRIQSGFPFDMFKAFKSFESDKTCIVYPERKGLRDVPHDRGQKGDHEHLERMKNHGLFLDYREFQKSDSPIRIDWKRSLKHQKHLLKNFEASGEKRILLDWEMTAFITDFEDRISQLALWIDLCQKRQDLYSLRIKQTQTEFSNHPTHFKVCMERLALLSPDEVS